MTSFLTDLAKPYVEKLINGGMAESRYICCFTCIVKDFEEEKARLEVERTTIKQRVDVATRGGDDVQANALFWEKEADELIQEDTKSKQKCFFGLLPHCMWQYRRGKELSNKKEHIKKLMETGKELRIGLPARLPDVERYSSRHYIFFESRESKYKELLDALKDDNNYIVGLQGMGGTGKTTLAKEVGKELKQSQQFTQIIDTVVSCSPDIKKIQDDIAGPLGLKWDVCSESDRPKILWRRLTNGEKILIILDDVWGDIDFDEIGIPGSDNHKGCRIFVTTRNLLVCNRLGCNKTIQLELLSDKDAWIMFKRYAGLSETSSKSLLDKGIKISNECKKLPIAIAAIASSLKGEQRQEEWDVALKSLQKHMSMHDNELVKIYKCLKFSYDNMKDEKAKGLFLLCSVFQEDEKISIGKLTRLGIGVGLFGEDYGSYEDARSQVIISKNKLLDSCLFLEADQWSVKMHDLVRDAAQWIANKEIQTVNLYDKNQKAMIERDNDIKYLLCEAKQMDVFPYKFGCSKLEILIITMYKDGSCHDVKIEVPNSFFENNTGLRVFYLCGDIYRSTLSFPQSIISLKNVRSLLFERVNLGDISILGNLQSLETLDLVHCEIDELPRGITELEKFRLLNLNSCAIISNNPFEVIKGCSSLEELYFINSFNDFCREITFPKLQRFCVDDYFGLCNESPPRYVCIRENDKVFLSESTLKYCMQTAELLELRRIVKGWRNLMPDIVSVDQGMNDLFMLRLHCISQLQFLIDTKHIDSQVPNVFSKLVVLELYQIDNLEELCNGPLSFDSFMCLEKLLISDCKHLKSLFNCKLNLCSLKRVSLMGCPMLISLFQLCISHSLVLLEELYIFDCRSLENIIIDEREGDKLRDGIVNDDDDDDDDSGSHGSMFPKLKDLNIVMCSRLEFILSFLSTQDLPALESIRIHSCDKLKYIFLQDVALGSLKQMKLGDLQNLIDIFPNCHRTIKGSPSMSRDTYKPQTQYEHIKCNIFSWSCYGKKNRQNTMSTTSTKAPLISEDQHQDCLNASESNLHCMNLWERAQCLPIRLKVLCNIKEIELSDFSKMKSVFVLSNAPRMLLLETLKINNCFELKHIIIDTGDHDTGGNNWGNVFPKLKTLYVENCVQLQYIFGHYTGDHQNHTEIHVQLPAFQCLNLHNLPSLIAICSKQYRTTFPHLTIVELNNCSQVDIISIGDFITRRSVARSMDGTTIKELSGNMEHFLALKKLIVNNFKVETIFCLNKVNEQKMNLGLEKIELHDLPVMTCLFVGPKNSFAVQNLKHIKIVQCEKLEILFSTSILRYLPQLLSLRIEECKELKSFIEDDLENQKNSNSLSSRACFPKLKTLVIIKCNKLKCVFPVSIWKGFSELEVLMIRESDELEEIFKSEGDHKVELPNLKYVVFDNLPSLCHAQGIQFQAIKNRFVQNCQKLSLTSASTAHDIFDIYNSDFNFEFELYKTLEILFHQLKQESEGHDPGNESPSAETPLDFAPGIEVQGASGHELTSSQVLMNEQSMDQQCLMNNQYSLGEIDTSIKPFQGIEASVEEGTTSTNTKTVTSPTHLELVNSSLGALVTSECKPSSQENGDDQIAMASFPLAATETTDQVNVSSTIEQPFPKEDEIIVSKSRPSSIVSEFPLMPSKGDPSHIDENLSSSLVVTRELEQLVFKKYLNHENLSLLTDFLVKNPYVRLKDISLSNRYKGCAYNLLAELLKFLKIHSVLDVLGSCHSEFVELLQDARSFVFDKDWLDGVERRALFPDIKVSQDALKKLLDSKQQVTKDVEVLRLKIDILGQHVEDLKHQLTSSEAILETIIQQEATLSAPIGY